MPIRTFGTLVAVAVFAAIVCGLVGEAGSPVAVARPKYHVPPSTNPACIPAPYDENDPGIRDHKIPLHRAFLERGKQGDVDVLFLGDSITMHWHVQPALVGCPEYGGAGKGGEPIWKRNLEPLKAVNFGAWGDQTQHLLWRITDGGELEGLDPKVVVLMIGTNNLSVGHKPEQIAEGIRFIVDAVRAQLPRTRILLLGAFPRGQQPDDPFRVKTRQVNALIAGLQDNERVFYLDVGPALLDADGVGRKDVQHDFLHLTSNGYRIWAETMAPYLDDLLHNQGTGPIWTQAGKPEKPTSR
jgi:lysophospholipase L1-like esterase